MGSSRKSSRRSPDQSRTGHSTARFQLSSAERRRLRFESLEDRQLLAVFSVSNLSDEPVAAAGDFPSSLRQAIFDANANGEADTIDFSVIGNIDLIAQLPTITEQLTINGGGAITLDADGASYRVFKIDDGTAASIEVELSGLHITGGNPIFSDESSNGGGVLSREILTLTSSTVAGNLGNFGAGLYVENTTTIVSSTFSGNSANAGGGGIWNSGTLSLTSSTIANNSAGGFGGAGIYNQLGGTVFLANSIVATNTSSFNSDILGSVDNSSSFNLIGNASSAGGLTDSVNDNVVGADPRLTPLNENGGGIPTHALVVGSPALHAGDDSVTEANDQRGPSYLRDDGNGVDIGAYERQTLPSLSLVVDTISDVSDNDYSAGELSLREAIALANGSAGSDTITFGSLFDTPQTINLGSQLPQLTEDLTIDATGSRVTVDAGGGATSVVGDGYRVFRIGDEINGNVIEVTLQGLTLTGGDPVHGPSAAEGLGGAIYSEFENLILVDSTVTGNNAEDGGAIGSRYGTTTVTNSTISGNLATDEGGGIRANGSVINVSSSTITDNSADAGGGIHHILSGAINLSSSIVTGNTAATDANISGTLTTNTFNIIGGDPRLGPLADNGGQTYTHAIPYNSPAVNRGDPTITSGNDQRGPGFPRVQFGRADVGAYELEESVLAFDLIISSLDETRDGNFAPGELTLAEAIFIANIRAGADVIQFDTTLFAIPQTINITSELPRITDSVSILGPTASQLTLDAGGGATTSPGDGVRIFTIDDGSANLIDVELSHLKLIGGDPSASSSFGTIGGAINNRENLTISDSELTGNIGVGGGALHSEDGTLVVQNTTFSQNMATSPSPGGAIRSLGPLVVHDSSLLGNSTSGVSDGGAIYSFDTLTITGSTLHGNTTGDGGAIFHAGIANVLTLTNSTLSGNTASLGEGGAIYSQGILNISNSTLSNNTAAYGGGVYNLGPAGVLDIASSTITDNTALIRGGGVNIASGTAHISGSIVAGNTAGADANVAGTLSTNAFNLIDVDPMLGLLADNGGPTLTHAPLAGSPVIDLGDPAIASHPNYDQRDFAFDRIVGGRIDIGAFESGATSADFDTDGDIDGKDFLTWQRNFGSTTAVHPDGDANIDTVVNGADLSVWISTFGEVEPPPLAGKASEEQGASSQPTAASAALIDAALALEWLGLDETKATGFPREQVPVEAAFAVPADVQSFAPTMSLDGKLDSVKATFEEVEATGEPWLTGGLLEEVFG